jgi:hypothetical protein
MATKEIKVGDKVSWDISQGKLMQRASGSAQAGRVEAREKQVRCDKPLITVNGLAAVQAETVPRRSRCFKRCASVSIMHTLVELLTSLPAIEHSGQRETLATTNGVNF